MDKIPCRGCRTELSYEVTTCPICLRPRTKYEITRDYALLRENQARRRRRPFVILGVLAALGAVGAAAHRFRVPLLAAYASLNARASKMADDAQDPQKLLGRPSGNDPASTPAPARPTEPPAPNASAPTPAAAPPAQAASTPAPASGPAPTAARSPSVEQGSSYALAPISSESDASQMPINPTVQWTLRGRVYDLLTLKPVAGIRVSVQILGADGGVYPSTVFTTDREGRYSVALNRQSSGSYGFVAVDGGFANAMFYESDIPYRTLSAADRRDMAESARNGDVPQAGITDVVGESSIRRDLFVVPRR